MTTKPGKISKNPLQLNHGDLLGQLTGKEGSTLWLGRFTVGEIEQALEKYGVVAALRDQGLDKLVIRIEPFEEFAQALRIYCDAAQPENLVAEARLREVRFAPAARMQETFSRAFTKMLAIDWLLMQNPLASFSTERPALPGQRHPGLGQARRIIKLLMKLCQARGLAGIVNFPEFFHNAYLYRGYFHFYDPEREGGVRALYRDLQPLRLADMSWAIEARCVHNKTTGERFVWISDVQILPMNAAIEEYFASDWYSARVEDSFGRVSFELDEPDFHTFRQKGAVPRMA